MVGAAATTCCSIMAGSQERGEGMVANGAPVVQDEARSNGEV